MSFFSLLVALFQTTLAILGLAQPPASLPTIAATTPFMSEQVTNTVSPAMVPAPSAASPADQSSPISIPGMSEYTDSDFGFSFWYPSSWQVTADNNPKQNPQWMPDGTILETLDIASTTDSSTGVMIEEVNSPTLSITEMGQSDSASPVGVDQKYFFDPSMHTWMYENLSDVPTGKIPPGTISLADVSNNTMGGLHIFPGAARFGADVIIPLSAEHFLVVWTDSGGGYIDERDFANTILATDPSVATPVSQQEQTVAVHKEALLYGAVGKPIPSADLREWYVDDQYVYDARGNIVQGADPRIFAPVSRYSDGYQGTSEFFGADDQHVWYEGTPQAVLLAGADPATFEIIREPYQEFGTGYATGKTFTYDDNSFEKDTSHIWFQDALIPDADMATFVITGEDAAKDSNHAYTGDFSSDGNAYVLVDGKSITQ